MNCWRKELTPRTLFEAAIWFESGWCEWKKVLWVRKDWRARLHRETASLLRNKWLKWGEVSEDAAKDAGRADTNGAYPRGDN